MSELLMTPSREVYNGKKVDLTKEALEKSLDEVKKMTIDEVKTNLRKYESVNFNTKDVTQKTNTLEMTALYQKALTLLGYTTNIDARFGPTTRTNLKLAQEKKLNFKGRDVDGLPGPSTTSALIKELEKSLPKEEIIEDVTSSQETPINQKLEKIDKYLTEKEGYTKDGDNYINKDGDLTLSIRDGKLEFTRNLKRAFSWDLNTTEKNVLATVTSLLK